MNAVCQEPARSNPRRVFRFHQQAAAAVEELRMAIEYTVRPVVRFFVTRWADGVSQGPTWNSGSSYFGTFDSTQQANHLAAALAAHEPGSVAHLLAEPYPDATVIAELYDKAREVYGAKSFP
jgi:hypothetical protein